MNDYKLLKEQLKVNPITKVDQPKQLSSDEIALILRLVGQANFPVKDIETLYVAIYKLQEQFKQQVTNGITK